jgi:hypothetical protein
MRPRQLAAIACASALLAVSPPAAADPPAIRSPGLLAGGVVLAVAGGAAMTLGIVRIAASETCSGACANPKGNEIAGGVALGAGAAVLAGGIVMIVIGSRPPPAKGISTWMGEPGGAGWRWRF